VLREARPLANLLCPFFSYSLPDFYNDELQQLPRNIGQFGYGMWIALSSKQGGLYGNLKKSERRDRVDTAVGDRHTDTDSAASFSSARLHLEAKRREAVDCERSDSNLIERFTRLRAAEAAVGIRILIEGSPYFAFKQCAGPFQSTFPRRLTSSFPS